MIYEFRTHTIRPGCEGIVAEATELLMEIRGDSCGKLEGCWTPATGHLNQIHLLWSYPDRNERHRLRDELMKNERWMNEYLPMIAEHVNRFKIRILEPIAPLHPPASEGNIYVLRTFRAIPGQIQKWTEKFLEILPVREKYSKNVGAWVTDGGDPDEACLMYSYQSIQALTETHKKMSADPDWNRFVEESSKFLQDRHITVLSPTPASPMR